MKLLGVNDVMRITGRGRSWAYKVIRQLNEELKDKGFMTIPGKIPEKYLKERFYS